ncbi:Na+ driven multidrug efflux pump [Fusobacterium necrophorum subsp. funduliforme]
MSLSHNFLEQESIGKLLWKFSLPAVVGMIVNALYNVVDRIYIGHIEKVGHLAITGVGVIFPVMLLSFAFALLVGLGSSANISLHLGKKERDRAEQFLGNSLVLGSIFSLVFMILIFLVMKKVIYFVG